MGLWSKFLEREDASTYISKDADMPRILHTKDFLALGVGTIVSTAIFTLPTFLVKFIRRVLLHHNI